MIGITTSQAARNVLAQAGIRNAWNSTRFLSRMSEAGERLPERTLIVIDEGSTISMTHLAEIVRLAERDNAKLLISGDHQQLAAVESGGGMSLLAGYLGRTQLAVPVRFTAEWSSGPACGCARATRARWRPTTSTAGSPAATRLRCWRMPAAATCRTIRRRHVLLIADTREAYRELSRSIRDDLMHLGLVDETAR